MQAEAHMQSNAAILTDYQSDQTQQVLGTGDSSCNARVLHPGLMVLRYLTGPETRPAVQSPGHICSVAFQRPLGGHGLTSGGMIVQ